MALVERYLHAVGNHLPAHQRDDILLELGGDLGARFEERAEGLGRPLTEDEEADLLRPYGRPVLMAARYRPRQHLIGPEVFPYYWTTLKLALLVALVVHVAVVLALAAAGRPLGRSAEVLFGFPLGAGLSIFAWVTLAFALFDAAVGRVKIKDNWDPRRLPRIVTTRPRASRLHVALELVLSAAFVFWWTTLPRTQEWLFGPAASQLTLTPALAAFYIPVLVVAGLSMGAKVVTLVRPEWLTFRFVTGLAASAAGLVVTALLLRAGDLVAARVPGAEADALAVAVNALVRVSFVVAIVVSVIAAAGDIRRFLRGSATHRSPG